MFVFDKKKIIDNINKKDNYEFNEITTQAVNLIMYLMDEPWVSNSELDITSFEVIEKASEIISDAYDSLDKTADNVIVTKMFNNLSAVQKLKEYFNDAESKQMCSTEDFF